MSQGFTKGKVIGAIIGGGIVFYLGNRATHFTMTEYAAGTPVNEIPKQFLPALGASLFQLDFDQAALIGGTVAAVLFLLIVLYGMSGKKNTRQGEEQGSAAWATARDMKPLTTKNPAERLQLTATEGLALDPYKTRRNLNVCVLGASGTGKTRGYVLPNLSTIEGWSFAVTDPKGEIYRTMRKPLEAKGLRVRTFNLVDLRQSNRFNPLAYINDTEPETGVAQLTETIMANTSGKESRGDGFWERAERALLTALIAYVWATTTEESGQMHLPSVVDLHKAMEGSESNPDEFNSDTDLKMEAARKIVEEWKADPAAFGAEDEAVMKMLDFAARQYRVYQQGPAETRLSVVISLGVRLAPLDMHDVREILSSDDIGLDRVGREPTALFLQLPDTHVTFRFLAAMFWQSLFAENVYIADHNEGGTLDVPLHCFLDEFANIGKIPSFEVLMATIRSRGISASIIVQAFSQGKAIWRDDWNAIVGNCDSLLFLGGRDQETNEWLSKQLGDETITMDEFSQTYGVTGSRTKAQRTLKRALLTADEIGRMSNDEAILLIRGLKPFKSRKAAIKTTAGV